MSDSRSYRSFSISENYLPPKSFRQWIRDLFPNLRDAAIRWSEDDAGSMAASVAYYLALSLFPMVLLLISGLGMFLKFTRMGQDARQQLFDVIGQQGSPIFAQTFRQVVEQFENQSMISGPTGVLAAILAAIGVFAQLDRGFDRVWRIEAVRSKSLHQTVYNVIRHRFAAFMMLLSLGAIIASVFALSMVVGQVRTLIDSEVPFLSHIIGWIDFVFTVATNAVMFTIIYRFLPKRPVRWQCAFRGGILTATIWEIGRFVLGAFFIGMRYTSAYGVVGSFIAILLWCYYAMSIIFFGAEYVQVLQRKSEKKSDSRSEVEKRLQVQSQIDAPESVSASDVETPQRIGLESFRSEKPRQRPRPATLAR